MRIELTYKGFADLSLTTWVPRPETALCKGKKLERETGFEPATSTLARSHSTAELLPLVCSFYSTCALDANSLHTHRDALVVALLFRVGYSTAVRQEALNKLGLGIPPLAAVFQTTGAWNQFRR